MNMTPERFAQLVEIHGSRPERWPADERMAAEAFRLADHQAQALGVLGKQSQRNLLKRVQSLF